MPIAMPRRRANQSDMCASSGANVAALPKPMSRPCASAYCQSVDADAATAYPAPSAIVPSTTGTTMPKRSDRRPMTMLPTPKPSIVSV